MRGLLVEEWTEFDKLEIKEIPHPALGPKEVRLATKACGVSFATSLFVAGKYQRRPPLPFVPGTEAAGVITEVGSEVTRFQPGDRVCAVLDWGGLAEEAVAKAVNVFPIPDSLPFAESIAFTNSYHTSYAALVWPHLARLRAGETLLVHGAAGGVGIAAVEIGKILGATVIGTAGSPEKLEAVKAHGADHAIDYRSGPFRDAVLDLTGGKGANVILDPVGGEVFAQSLRCIAPEGRILPIGFAGGTIQSIPANLLLVKNVTAIGFFWAHYRKTHPDWVSAAHHRMFGWWREGKIRPVTSHQFPLAEFVAAMQVIRGREAIGKVVLQVR